MKSKKCSKCGEVKLENEFYAAKPSKSKSWCKECEKFYQKEMYKNHPEKRLERAKKWREKYRDKHNAKRKENRMQIYITESARKYGIDKAQAAALAETTKCECCGIAFENLSMLKKRNIDHCHKSGKVRGAICSRCNTVLGLIEDDATIAEKIIVYIARS